ncbi:hypothetical protein [Massilia sp. 9096]|uniref:hypothetical protein n=1 Tax=Massilia sp. 9096 TaxID=1500894 RepID=UPI00056ADB15|nr:hypothetical protein [Massilia sp. 9096]
MHHLKRAFAAAALSAGMAPAFADVITLDFEGSGNLNPNGDYYNGAGGPNYGISFSGATLAIVDEDAGGTGNFSNEPSPNTVMFFLDDNEAVLNTAVGFDTGLSFHDSSSKAASVTVYDGLNGTGKVLARLPLSAPFDAGCSGDPIGTYCNWTPVGATSAGTARWISFAGTADRVGYDNITFGAVVPVPQPSEMLMLAAGLAAIGLAARQGRTGLHG